VTTEINDLIGLSDLVLSLVVNEDSIWTDALEEVIKLRSVTSTEDFLGIVLTNFENI
jgi:hypothetical protein